MINVNASKDLKEFHFTGNPSDYKEFITSFSTREIFLQKKENEFYPIEIGKIEIEESPNVQLLITFFVETNTLKIKGGKDKLDILIKSIENLSNLSKAGHFHIDYFGNSDLISQEDISLILDLVLPH